MTLTSERCRQVLLQWHGRQSASPVGPTNLELYERVCDVLRKEPDETAESTYIALTNEVRGVTGSKVPKQRTAKQKGSVNERLLAAFQAHPERLGWSASKWAEQFGCTDAAVKQTKAWDTIMTARSMEELRRQERQR